jgi:hypothetical protein
MINEKMRMMLFHKNIKIDLSFICYCTYNGYDTRLDLLPSKKELIAHQIGKELRIYNITDYEGVPSIQMITLEK